MSRTSRAVAVALVLSALALTGCGIVKDATKIAHNVEGNKATIDAFTNKVKSGEATTFEATYVSTGSSPATIVYAVEPPNGLAFKATPSGGSSSVDIIVNFGRRVLVHPPGPRSGGGTDVSETGDRRRQHGEQDLRDLHACPLDGIPAGLLHRGRIGR